MKSVTTKVTAIIALIALYGYPLMMIVLIYLTDEMRVMIFSFFVVFVLVIIRNTIPDEKLNGLKVK